MTCKQCGSQLPPKVLLADSSPAHVGYCSKECMAKRIADLEAAGRPFAELDEPLDPFRDEVHLIELFNGFESDPVVGATVGHCRRWRELLRS